MGGQRDTGAIVGAVIGRLSKRLLDVMQQEFERNGRKMLSPGKVRYLRRLIRRAR